MSDELNLDDIAPIAIPLAYSGKRYMLHEASVDAACKWRNAQLRASKIVDGKISGLEGMPDSEPLLISLCLMEVTEKGERAVTLVTIRSWPNRVTKKLYDKIHDISDLHEKDTKETLNKEIAKMQEALKKIEAGEQEDASKNEPSATTDTSV